MRKKIREFLSMKDTVNTLYIGTFGEYAADWLQMKRTKAIQSGKGGGYERLEISINKYISPYLGSRKLIDITTEDLQLFINEYSKGYSESSTRQVLTPLKQIFQYAYSNGHIASNPALLLYSINNENYGKKTKVTIPLRKDKIEEFEQICKLKFKNGKYKYHLGFAFILILNTGLRRGEAIALKWSDIDLDKKVLYVHSAVVKHKINNKYDEVIEKPKTKNSERMIPLNNKAINALLSIKEIHSTSEWVTSTLDGKRVSLSNINDYLSNMLVKNHMEPFGLHVLRHPYVKPTTKNFSTFLKFLCRGPFITYLPYSYLRFAKVSLFHVKSTSPSDTVWSRTPCWPRYSQY